jgi:deoxycytidine triphosphate deaminase
MILCDREIQALVRNKVAVIDPCPPPESRRWSSMALDLTLHGVLLEWIVDPTSARGSSACRPACPSAS